MGEIGHRRNGLGEDESESEGVTPELVFGSDWNLALSDAKLLFGARSTVARIGS